MKIKEAEIIDSTDLFEWRNDQGNTRFVKLLNQLLSGKEIKNYAN